MIAIDNNGIAQESEVLKKHIESFKSVNDALNKIIADTSQMWKGPSSDAYNGAMLNHARQAVKMLETLRKYQEYVEKANKDFVEADKAAARKIRGSF